MVHRRERLHDEQFRHALPGLSDAADIVAQQIDNHQIFSAIFGAEPTRLTSLCGSLFTCQPRQRAADQGRFGCAAAPATGSAREKRSTRCCKRRTQERGERRAVAGAQLAKRLPFISLIVCGESLRQIDLVTVAAARVVLNALELLAVLLPAHIGAPIAQLGVKGRAAGAV